MSFDPAMVKLEGGTCTRDTESCDYPVLVFDTPTDKLTAKDICYTRPDEAIGEWDIGSVSVEIDGHTLYIQKSFFSIRADGYCSSGAAKGFLTFHADRYHAARCSRKKNLEIACTNGEELDVEVIWEESEKSAILKVQLPANCEY